MTTRIEGRENDDLLSVYGFRGFPSLAYLDADAKKLVEPQGRDVAAFAKGAKTVGELLDLRAKVAAGDKKSAPKLLMLELEMGSVSYADAKAQMAAFKKLDPEMKKKMADLLFNAEINEIMGSINSQEAFEKAGATFAKYAREGKVPTGDTAIQFWSAVSQWADTNIDPELYEKSYAYLKGKFGDDKRYDDHFKQMGERLEAIKVEAAEAAKEPKP